MKPILFNTEMVKAILDGRKTETRKEAKPELRKSDGKRYCPIQIFGSNRLAPFECIESNCRWWAAYAEDCSVPLIAGILADSSINRTIFSYAEELQNEKD